MSLPCALGRAGTTRVKREGDGATPIATVTALGVFFRPDRLRRPGGGLPARPIRPGQGWCDAPADRRYNRPVALPYPASHEDLWREDALYDAFVDLSWNRAPVRPGRGSAIFLHVAGPGFAPTAGCVAVERRLLPRLLARLGPRTMIEIGPVRMRPRRP